MKKTRPGPNKPDWSPEDSTDLRQPDERDETPERDPFVDFKKIGPRMVIEQAGRDIAQGLQDTDLHGTPTNVPGPQAAEGCSAKVPASGGDKRSYSDTQGRKASEDAGTPPGSVGKAPSGKE